MGSRRLDEELSRASSIHGNPQRAGQGQESELLSIIRKRWSAAILDGAKLVGTVGLSTMTRPQTCRMPSCLVNTVVKV